MKYKYSLIKKGKTICPQCERKTFVLYIDHQTGKPLHSTVGKCDRADNCAYHYTPKQYFDDNFNMRTIANNHIERAQSWNIPQIQKPIEYFNEKIMLATLAGYQRNSFVNSLRSIFDAEQIYSIISRYKLGTTKSGAVVFWQMDTQGRVRYGKVMHYLSDMHRDKSKPPRGYHSLMGRHDFNHRQCFFGEHLLSLPENKNKAVAIIESEKSACICSEALSDYVWLAAGGKSGIKWTDKNTWASLKGRKVVLFPDVDAHDGWVEKSVLFRSFGIDVSVFELLAKVAQGTQQDIADHIITYFRQRKEPKPLLIMQLHQINHCK